MDRIKSQQFKDRGRSSWMYSYQTDSGRSFEVYYDITNMGHCRELLIEKQASGAVTLWNRELKIGDQWKPFVKDFIEGSCKK